jgi:hypothetical protein
MTGTATATTQVEQLIEDRLKEIEEQLRPFAALEDERRRLTDALGALRGGNAADARVAGAAPDASPVRQRRTRRVSRGGRAPRGSNLRAILEYVGGNPGATAGEIATATDISRGVVYSATSRLSSSGKLQREQKPDGQVGYRLVSRRGTA